MKKTFLTSLAVCFLTVSAPAQEKKTAVPIKTPEASSETVKTPAAALSADPVAEFKKWDEKLFSLKASFVQEVFFTEADIKQTVEGVLYYKKPNLLRIDHLKPSKQEIVTDKKNIYVYKIDDNQVIKTSWDYWKKTQNGSFSGILDFGDYSSLLEKNEIKTLTRDGLPVIEIRNRENPKAYLLSISLSSGTYFPAEAELTIDSTLIKTRLTSVEINKDLDSKFFDFEKPKKAELIELKNK